MSQNIKGNGKHLTFSNRVYIEQELMQRSSFRSIAANLGKDPSTISKEVRLHCAVAPNGTYRFPRCNFCKHFGACKDTIFMCTSCTTMPVGTAEPTLNFQETAGITIPFHAPTLSLTIA